MPHTSGLAVNSVLLCPEARTIAEMLSDEYDSAYIGMRRLWDDPAKQHGFDRWLRVEDATLNQHDVISGLRMRDSATSRQKPEQR